MLKHHHRLTNGLKKTIFGYFTEYETPKLVLIHSTKFAVLLRVLQIIILIYSIAYLLIYKKGYQMHDTSIISAVILKMKGVGYVQLPDNQTIVVDVADYIIPPSENNAVFIMTNFIQTDQHRATCPESASLKEAVCVRDRDCQNRPFSPRINGRWTGRCLISSSSSSSNSSSLTNQTSNSTQMSLGLCEYAGWCPAEDDLLPPKLVKDVLNFTLFIKNFIEFPAFDVKHKNLVDELKPCVFDPKNDPDCPIFAVDYIIQQAEKNVEERQLMLRYGGVIRIQLQWDCNLDQNIKLCKPVYSFARLDVPFRDKPFSIGFNFRHGAYWKYHGDHFRTLTKAYGLRFIITVSGKAGKFDFITLTFNTGSLVGIFGLATFLCDILLLQFSKKASIYRNHVFETVHLRTRTSSVMNSVKNINTNDLRRSPTGSNDTTTGTRKSPGKAVAFRSLAPDMTNNLESH